jgi:integrase
LNMGTPKSEREKFLADVEFRKLLVVAERDDRAFLLFWAGGVLGLRVSEAVGLERACFRRLGVGLVDVPTLKQKGHPVKSVAVDRQTRELLREYIARMPRARRWLFESRKAPGKHISRKTAHRLFKFYARLARLNPAYSFHALRHYRGCKMWRATKDLKFCQSQLRHSQMATTEKYVHLDEREAVRMAERIGV